MTCKETDPNYAVPRVVQFEQEWLARFQCAEGAWARLPEIDFIDAVEVAKLIKPISVSDAYESRRRPGAKGHSTQPTLRNRS